MLMQISLQRGCETVCRINLKGHEFEFFKVEGKRKGASETTVSSESNEKKNFCITRPFRVSDGRRKRIVRHNRLMQNFAGK